MASLDLFLMSPPGPNWALRGRANFRSAQAAPVDPVRALAEWLTLADAIEARGGRVICLVPPDDTKLTGLPYAGECGQLVRKQNLFFLLPTMKPEHRRGERTLWTKVAQALKWIPMPIDQTWEAQGDVAFFRGRTLLFFGGRTTLEGACVAAQYFVEQAEPLFVEIREPAFHGNMAALPLPAADRMLVCPDVLVGNSYERLREVFGADRLIPVSEDEIRLYATNGLPIGRDVLVPHLVPRRVRALLTELGLNVVELEMVELCEKAGGASRCLVSHAPIEVDGRESDFVIPPEYDYRRRRAELLARAKR
jgi:N-dimethylarginine dimethylaminohydrolase